MENLIRKNIRSLVSYSSARDEYSGKEGIFLDANENPFGMYNRYPDPHQNELKKQLAQLKQTPETTIFIGNGSDEVIDLAFRIFCEPNQDKALTFTPTYGMYEVSANINAVELIKLPLNQNFQINTTELHPYLSDPKLKLIFICSPNNPTGNLINVQDIEFVLQNFKGMVIIDEAYIDFCEQASFIEKINEYPNLIVSQTLSKAWGLAGIRIGIAYMNQWVLTYYNKVKAPYNVSVLNQKIAVETLQNTAAYAQKRNEILDEKQKMIDALASLDLVQKIYPSDANFLLVEVADANKIYNQLIQQQIIIRNRNAVIPNCIRITIGTPDENKKLINALKTIQ